VALLRRAGVRTVVTTSEHAEAFRSSGFAVLEVGPLAELRDCQGHAAVHDHHNQSERPGDARETEDREALLLFTSGTTGEPKLVSHTHQSVFDGVHVLATAWGFSPDDILVHMLPLHHLHGICVALLQCFLSGARTRLLPRFDAPAVVDACVGASVLMGVPTQYHKLLAYLDTLTETEVRHVERVLRGLRLVTSGSAKLPEAMGQRLCALTGQYPLERYGMTEVGIVLSNPLQGARRPGSAGQPLPGVNARIVGEDGQDVGPGASGELWIAAPSVFRGYEDNRGASEESFVGRYFRTGDTALWLPDGFVQLLGRTSVDIIKSGGEKLSALEL
jgi:malonyl-CoA/methylmalonyl-CoA synthetase